MPLSAVITVVLFKKIITVRITVANTAVLESESNVISKSEAGIHTTPCCSSIVVPARLQTTTIENTVVATENAVRIFVRNTVQLLIPRACKIEKTCPGSYVDHSSRKLPGRCE
jgi:hypothetical protein